MTVNELIEELQKIKDKEQPVFVWGGGYITSQFNIKQEFDKFSSNPNYILLDRR